MPALSKVTRFHLWIPEIWGFKGGIQVYSAFLIDALQSLYPEIKYDIFLKHDTKSDLKLFSSPNTHFYCTGAWPRAIRTSIFASKLFGQGISQRPDLIISTHLNFTIVAYWLKLLFGIPYWTIAHGIEAWNVQDSALQKAVLGADHILSVSNYTRDRLLETQNIAPEKISILPCTFEANRFQISSKPVYLLERYHLNSAQPIILTVCRLSSSEQYKGYDQIIAALPEIRQAIPNVHYVLVGKGDDLSRIEQIVARLQLQDCVTLTGFVPDEELCDYYNLCDVFAMPSKGEGFGIVYLEALACGKPILGGNQDAAVDALCYGELGALVNPDDLEAIAQTLIELLQGKYSNSLLYQPQALRQKAIATFGFSSFKQTLGDYLENYLEKCL